MISISYHTYSDHTHKQAALRNCNFHINLLHSQTQDFSFSPSFLLLLLLHTNTIRLYSLQNTVKPNLTRDITIIPC